MFLRKLNLSTYLLICFLFVLIPFASASPESNPRRAIPTFTQTNVQQMLDSLDTQDNIAQLKIRYFGGHVNSPFPADKGFELLQNELQEQKMGTLKWFQLESLKGYAAFHVPDIPVIEGFDAYGLLFDKDVIADSPQTQHVVRTSVLDFVSFVLSVNASLGSKNLSTDSLIQKLLVNAWNAWYRLPPLIFAEKHPIDWGRAIAVANAQDKFTAIIEDALKDTTHPPNLPMLKMAVVVLQDKEPQRAIELLKTAQSKLQPDDVEDQQWLYQDWVQLITGKAPQEQQGTKVTDKAQLAQLVEMRKDQISYTGTGYGDLLKLYWQLGENDKATELIKVVNESGISTEEKINVADVLLHPQTDIAFSKDAVKQMQAQGVDLLQKYLSSLQENPPNPLYKGELSSFNPRELHSPQKGASTQNTLEIKNELHARYLLGLYFMRQDRVTEEGKALQTDDLKPPFRSSESAAYYDQILQLRAALEKKLSGVEGVK